MYNQAFSTDRVIELVKAKPFGREILLALDVCWLIDIFGVTPEVTNQQAELHLYLSEPDFPVSNGGLIMPIILTASATLPTDRWSIGNGGEWGHRLSIVLPIFLAPNRIVQLDVQFTGDLGTEKCLIRSGYTKMR